MSNEFKNDETLNKANEINDFFKMPIYYNANKIELKKNIINDLELVSTVDQSCNPIYEFCFNNDNDISKKLIEQVSKYYTTDTLFLKDNQKLLKEYKREKNDENKYTDFSPNYKNIIEIWNELKVESGFKEKYYYVDWEMLEFLNNFNPNFYCIICGDGNFSEISKLRLAVPDNIRRKIKILSHVKYNHSLIKQSESVFLVNSGVGFEALLHEKPVYCYGQVEYDCVINKVKCLEIDYLMQTYNTEVSVTNYKKFINRFVSLCHDTTRR